MSRRTINLTDELHAYLVGHGATPDPIVAELMDETLAVLPSEAGMQIAPEEAAFLTFLTRLIGARQAVEVGTFTGLSSLSIARGLPADGKLICFDISDEYTSIARRYWQRAGLTERIELRLGPAADLLATLPAEPHIDLAFIDADKTGYPAYWEALVPRMRPGGVIAVDNVLRHGRIVDPAANDPDTVTMVGFNEMILADKRVEAIMLPLADGVTLARRL